MDVIEPARAALLVIDVQYDFVDKGGAAYAGSGEFRIERLSGLIAGARAARVPVVYTQEVHRRTGIDGGRLLWDGRGGRVMGTAVDPGMAGPPCVEGTHGARIVAEVAPEVDDVVVVKRRQSAFMDTELDQILRRLAVDTLLVTGLCSNVCVLWTVGDAFQLGYRVRVVEDCTGGTTDGLHLAALTLMRQHTNPGTVVTAEMVERHLVRAVSASQ